MRCLALYLVTAGLAAGSATLIQHAAAADFGGAAPAPVLDAAQVGRGETLYQDTCAACHGGDGSGGPGGAVNLTQSALATAPDGGRSLKAFLDVGRPEKGMPPFLFTAAQNADLNAKLRSLRISAEAKDRASGVDAADGNSVLVGDAHVGKAFFEGPVGRCNTCHATADGQTGSASSLAHVASRYPDARAMQNNMLLNRSFFWSPSLGKDITATVSFADGRTVSGYLTSVSDFKVIIRDEQDREQTYPRAKGEPKVVLKDRLQHHLDLLEVYRDADIHNLTAYLATLK